MSESGGSGGRPFDFSAISDPQLRRTMRAVYQQLAETIARQQTQIEALLEMIVDRHVCSLGEFKRYLARTQQRSNADPRIHEALAAPAPESASTPQASPPRAQPTGGASGEAHEDDDTNRPRVYRL